MDIKEYKLSEYYLAYTELQLKDHDSLDHISKNRCQEVLVIHNKIYCVVKKTTNLSKLEVKKYKTLDYKWETIEDMDDMSVLDFKFYDRSQGTILEINNDIIKVTLIYVIF